MLFRSVFGNLGYINAGSIPDTENGVVYYCFKRLVKEKNTELKVSYLEIYNEQVKDLLGDDDNLKISENSLGDLVVQGLNHRPVVRFDELIDIVKSGNLRRKVAQTCANAFSSRSHAILQILIKRKSTGGIINSKLSFIDLAGSERVQLTQNKGLRLVEGSNINKSLLALGKVITSLSERTSDSYVNFRDSKLTRLLKDSLGGNTKTVLITCISSLAQQADETIHSLNYAARAKKIKLQVTTNIGQETQQTGHYSDQNEIVKDFVSQISLLKGQIGNLELQLANEKGGRSKVEDNYKGLVKDIEEQWELKASILEVGEIIFANQERLGKKKRNLVQQDANEIKQKRLLIDEIHELENIVKDNIQIKKELEKRLSSLEDKKASKLGLNKRPVSPLIVERANRRKDNKEEIDKNNSYVSQVINERATEKKTTSKTISMMVTDNINVSQNNSSVDEVHSSFDKLKKLIGSSASEHNKFSSQISQSEYELKVCQDHDFGDLPISNAKAPKDTKKMINFDTITVQFPDKVDEYKSVKYEDQDTDSNLDYNSMHNQFMILSDPNHGAGANSSSREHKIQQKLQQAREKMREFKKKLNMMGTFLVKYEEKAMKRGSLDILKAVVVLLIENQKHKYLLNQEETEIANRMDIFVERFRYNNPDLDIPFNEMIKSAFMSNANETGKENIRPTMNKNDVHTITEIRSVSAFNPQLVEDVPLKSKAELKDKYISTLKNTSRLSARDDLHKTEFLINKINKMLN